MWQKIWHKLTTTMTGGAVTIAFFSIVSKALGLLRDRLLASSFGAGDTLDAYYAAFKLPDLVFNTLILGALSAAFIPIFMKQWRKHTSDAWGLANGMLTLLLGVVIVLCIIGIIFTPQLMQLVVPGFAGEKLMTTIHLTRIMFVSVIFFTVSNVLSGMLNAWQKFTAYALAPVVYNLGIIIGIVGLYPLWGVSGLAWGVVVGSFFHVAVQLPTALQQGWRYRFVFAWKKYQLRDVVRLMIPRTFALGVGQINQLIMVVIASTLAVGSVTIFNLANNLQSLNVLGIALAVSAFPVFTNYLAKKQHADFAAVFSLSIRRILYIMIPLSVFLFLLRAQVVRIILGAGMFDWAATIATAQTLGFFVLSLTAQSVIPLLTRVFYALEDTKTPVMVSIFSMALNIGLALVFKNFYGVAGLGLAFSIAAFIQMLVLVVWVKLRISEIAIRPIVRSVGIMLFMTFLMSIFVYASLYAVAPLVNMQTFIGVFVQTIVATVIAIIVYGALSMSFNMEEIEIITRQLKKIPFFAKQSK